MVPGGLLQALAAAGGQLHLVNLILQDASQHAAHDYLIVNNQNLAFGHRGASL